MDFLADFGSTLRILIWPLLGCGALFLLMKLLDKKIISLKKRFRSSAPITENTIEIRDQNGKKTNYEIFMRDTIKDINYVAMYKSGETFDDIGELLSKYLIAREKSEPQKNQIIYTEIEKTDETERLIKEIFDKKIWAEYGETAGAANARAGQNHSHADAASGEQRTQEAHDYSQRTDSQKPDYYAVLGVGRRSTADEIKAAYRELAKLYHPDNNPGLPIAEIKFKEINAAYEILGDAERRRDYDAQ